MWFEELIFQQKRRKKAIGGSKNGNNPGKDRMKEAFAEVHKAVLACEDQTGRKRCLLFRELPDKRVKSFASRCALNRSYSQNTKDYPDYYQLISQPIALSHIKKRANSGAYKTVQAFRDDFRLMFNNARTYNQEGSWVYVDADEMEKVFNAAFDRAITGSGLPGAPPATGASSISYDSAPTPMDEDERPILGRSRSAGRKQVISDEEYLTPSDDE